ncbi:hypothetical protein Tco_1241129, partial [Tanacetum coccineum]
KSIHPLSGSPTLSSDLVVASLSPYLTPFGDSDFLLEETDTFLTLDDSIPPEIDNGIYDSEGYIIFLEKLLNDDPTKDLPPKELKNNETKTTKSPIEEPPELELKDLPPHLEYAFLEGTSKLPVIIAKYLKREEKDQLNSHEDIDDLVPISRNEESDESEMETIMEEVQIYSSQSTAQIPPSYKKLNFDLTMPSLILTFSQFCYDTFGSHCVFDILGPRLLFSLSYGFGLVFLENFSKLHSLDLFDSGDEKEIFDPGIIVTDVDSKVGRNAIGY